MELDKRTIEEVAHSLRRRHLLSLMQEYRTVRRNLMTARRCRQRRARLISLARRRKLTLCLKRLRPMGTIYCAGGGNCCFTFEYWATRPALQGCIQALSQLRSEWKQLKENLLESLRANLVGLSRESELVPGDRYCVRWIVGQVVLEGVWIGDMEVTLDLRDFSVDAWNRSIEDGESKGYQHPHVSGGGEICWGENFEEALTYHRSGDFLALKDLIENLLRTYNPVSPYITLAQWGHEDPCCDECGESYPEDDLCWSESEGSNLCEYCRSYCDHCSEYVSQRQYDDRLDACRSCVQQHTIVCTQCQQRFWEEEIEMVAPPGRRVLEPVACCEGCKEMFLKSHRKRSKRKGSGNGKRKKRAGAAGADAVRVLETPVDVSPHTV